MSYDYIIVGGGPTGLSLALYLSQIGTRCLLLDKNPSLGGCHRVTRQEGEYFTEHGPRIYSSAYINVKEILKIIGTTWDEMFVPYRFNIADIQGQTFNSLDLREKALLAIEFLGFCIGINKRRTSIGEFMEKNNFCEASKDYVDRICRLTDGAGSDRYTVHQFLQLFNQNAFNKLFQPRTPNDKGLFRLWEQKLDNNGVEILKECDVMGISDNTVHTSAGDFFGNRILLTVPPKPFVKLIKNSTLNGRGLYDIWSNEIGMPADEWAEEVSYIIDIPISFHWKKEVALSKVWGFPRDDWGIAFIVLTDYMKPDPDSSLVISTCITRVHAKSTFTGKSAMESSEKEMIDETFRQLKISFPMLPEFNKAIVHKKTLTEEDTAYVETSKQYFMPMSTPNSGDIYYIGTHNGKSHYAFTSMESAVVNAMYALNVLEPDSKLRIKQDYKTVQNVIYLFFFLIVAVVLYILISRKRT